MSGEIYGWSSNIIISRRGTDEVCFNIIGRQVVFFFFTKVRSCIGQQLFVLNTVSAIEILLH